MSRSSKICHLEARKYKTFVVKMSFICIRMKKSFLNQTVSDFDSLSNSLWCSLARALTVFQSTVCPSFELRVFFALFVKSIDFDMKSASITISHLLGNSQ